MDYELIKFLEERMELNQIYNFNYKTQTIEIYNGKFLNNVKTLKDLYNQLEDVYHEDFWFDNDNNYSFSYKLNLLLELNSILVGKAKYTKEKILNNNKLDMFMECRQQMIHTSWQKIFSTIYENKIISEEQVYNIGMFCYLDFAEALQITGFDKYITHVDIPYDYYSTSERYYYFKPEVFF